MRARTHRLRRHVAVVSMVAVAAAACGGDEGPAEGEGGGEGEALTLMDEEIADAETWAAAQEQGNLTLYSALSEARELEIIERFEEDTGLSVDLVRLGGGRLFERVMSEHGAGQLGADVIRQTDVTLAREYQEAGVWEPYCHPFWDLSDPELQEPDCHYWTSQQPIYTLGYNSAVLEQEGLEPPSSWQDLLDPEYQGNIGLAHVGAGGSTWARDYYLRNEYGVEYWEDLAAQDPFITGAAGAVSEGNARGEFAVAMVIAGSQGIAQADGAPVEIVLPEDGIVSWSQWLGLAANSENTEAAEVFLNWNMSLAGQTAIAEVTGDYPVREDAPGPTAGDGELPPPGEVELIVPELEEEYETERDAWQAEWFGIFGYTPDPNEESG